MDFNIRQKGRKSDRDKSMIRLLKSPANMASGTSTIILLSDPNELCDSYSFAIVDKFLEYQCIFEKQQQQLLINCILLPEQV